MTDNADDREKNLQRILDSDSYIKAYEDVEFFRRDELRAVRLQVELLKPELIQQDEGIKSTIVVFGSARTPDPETAERKLKEAGDGPDKEQAERHLAMSVYYEQARELSRIISSTCQLEGLCEYVMVTGGGPGIMEAANRGAHDVGAKSVGLNITLPNEQEPNPYITPELCFNFHYFAIRKMHFLMRAKAVVAFPGGFGTMDELFEVLTLIQTGKMKQIPIVLFGKTFWNSIVDFQALVNYGMISAKNLDLLNFAETAKEAWDIISSYEQE